ncbi:MAG: hypothetical protein WC807_04075 [Hyphomicrobium sp.]|jgi:hypothetical protein
MRNSHIRALAAAPLLGATCLVGAATAQAPQREQPTLSQAEIAALAQNPAVNAAIYACSADRWRLCGGVLPGGGRIVRCLAEKAADLTPQCNSALTEARNAIAAANSAPPDLPARKQ